MKDNYNRTQLNPDTTFERHVFHRDQFAHYMRWSHVLKRLKVGMNVLDFGCGSANLLEVIYRNRYKAKEYLGLDVRPRIIKIAEEKYNNIPWAKFGVADLCAEISTDIGNHWDLITCFEVIEHIGKHNANKFLQNMQQCMNEKTILLLSTPVFNEKVGAAKNHIINEQVCEFEYNELDILLHKYFHVEKVFGTFASKKAIEKVITDEQDVRMINIFNQAAEYHDVNVLSVLFAYNYPRHSRNCMWVCKLKNN